MSEKRASLYCFIVAMIWGLGFIAVDVALTCFSCFEILLIRFVGSSVIAWLLMKRHINGMKWTTIKKGTLNGILLFITYALQTYAQTLTSIGNNAFLTASAVVIVPYLSWLFLKQKVTFQQVVSSFMCLIGICILTGSTMSFEKGDLISFVGAIFYALFLVSSQYSCQSEDTQTINTIQLTLCALLSIPCVFLFPSQTREISFIAVLACFYMIVFATFLCFYLQTKAQQAAKASKCSVILSTESLFAVMFSIFLLGDVLYLHMILGGALILGSVILVQIERKNV